MTEAVTALVFDARAATAGAAQFDAAGKRIVDSNTAVVTATTRTQAAIGDMDRNLARLQRQIDPVAAAQQRMVAQTTLLDRALQRGKVTAEEHARSIALVTQRYEGSVQAAQRATTALGGITAAHSRAAGSSGQFSRSMGQAGFQIQDFATQVAMGQNAMVAFGTQFAQFAGVFGTAGALAGAAVTIGVIAVQLLGAGDATKKLNEALKGSEEGYGSANTAAEAWLRGLTEEGETILRLTAYYASLDSQRRAYEVRNLEASRMALQRESMRLTNEAAGALSGLQRTVANSQDGAALARARGQSVGEVPADIRAATAALAAFNAARADDPARALVVLADALRQAARAGSDLAPMFNSVVAELDKATPSADRMTRQLSLNAAQLAAARGEAVGAAPAVAGVGTASGAAATQMTGLAGATQRAAAALASLRGRAVDDPLADVNAEVARLNQQLEALGRGGLAAYQSVLTAQERQAEVSRIATRLQTDFVAALTATSVPAAEAQLRGEDMAASFVAGATRQVDAAQRVTERVRALEVATRDAGRTARTASAAYGELSTNSSGLLSLGATDGAAISEAQRALRGSAIDPAMVDRTTSQAAGIEARALDVRTNSWRTSTDDIVRYSADAFANMTSGNTRGWRGMLDTLVSSSRAAFARIAAEAVIRPSVTAIVGDGAKSASGATSGLSGLGSLSSISGLFGGKSSSLGRFFGAPGDGANISAIGAGGDFAGKAGSVMNVASAPGGGGFGLSSLGLTSGSLGMAAAGFGVGSMLGGFTAGNSPNRQTNGQIGSAIGTAAGLALTPILGPFGPLLGGALGGAVGGLIGPGKGFAGGDAILGSDANGGLVVDRVAGKGFDSSGLGAQVTEQLKQVNATLSALGLRFGQGVFAAVGGGESRNPTSIGGALDQFGQRLEGGSANVNRAIQGRGFEEAVQAAQWVQQIYDPMLRSADAAGAFGNALADLRKPFEDAIAQAQKYGLSTDQLVVARDRAEADARRQNSMAIQDNNTALFGRAAQAGGSRLAIAGERARVMAESQDRERADAERFMEVSGLDPVWHQVVRDRLGAAQSAENAAMQRIFDELLRDQRLAAESLTSRITRAIAQRGGNARDVEGADLYDFDARARVELDGLRSSLRELGLAANVVESEVTRLVQAHTLERQAIIAAYAERRRLAAQSLDDRLFSAGNDNSTIDGALAAFDRAATAERVEAAKLGIADLVQLERVLAEERGKIVEDFARQARDTLIGAGGSIRAFLNEMRAGQGAGASPEDRLVAAQRQFGEDLALARGGDAGALSRITGTASSLLDASRDFSASGPEFQAMRRMVESSLESLPATRSYDALILEELRKLGGAVNVEVDLAVIRAISETLNALPDAERARLVQAQTVLRSVEERIGRFLTTDEVNRLIDGELVLRDVRQRMAQDLTAGQRAGLVQGGNVLRSIEQALGRQLTATEADALIRGGNIRQIVNQLLGRELTNAERDGLLESETVLRAIEQRLGANLTAAERASLVQAAAVERIVTQALGSDLTPGQRAGLVQGGNVLRSIQQALGRQLTATEADALIRGGNIRQIVNQLLGRELTNAERDGLIASETVLRAIEQRLGANLTAAERASLVQSAAVERIVTQALGSDLTPDQRAGLVQGGDVLRSIEQAIGRQLTATEANSLVHGGPVGRTIIQQMGRDLTPSQRAGLLSAEHVLRAIEQRLGADLTAAERASLVHSAAVERIVTQALGRDLTAAERAGLVQAASIIRSVEQSLGRQLTAAERAMIVLPGDVTRTVTQDVRAPTGEVIRGVPVTRTVTQIVETTETIQISRSIDEKIGAQMFVQAALLSEIVKASYATSHNTANMQRLLGGVQGMTSYTDPSKEQLYFRFRANANAMLQSVFREVPGDGLLGFDDLLAGSGQLFATGGAFAGGMVQRPTAFGMPGGEMGVMGEAGPEAIMPLRQMPDGSLGVRAISPMSGAVAELRAVRAELVAVKVELSELRRDQQGQTAVIAESGNRNIAGHRQTAALLGETAATQRLVSARPAA